MQVVSGADWSVGLNSFSSNALADTRVLAKLGSGLRVLYQDLTEEPLPEFLTMFVRELEEREQSQDHPSDQ